MWQALKRHIILAAPHCILWRWDWDRLAWVFRPYPKWHITKADYVIEMWRGTQREYFETITRGGTFEAAGINSEIRS